VRRFIVRTGLAISCLVTAPFVPFLALLMALIGSFLTINVSLIFPVGGPSNAYSLKFAWCQVDMLEHFSTFRPSQCPWLVAMQALCHRKLHKVRNCAAITAAGLGGSAMH
jgi:hypothetical protein